MAATASIRNRYIAESLEARVLLSVESQLASSVFSGMPAVFVPNHGQWDDTIYYAAHGTGADILLTDTGPTFRIVDRPEEAAEHDSASARHGDFSQHVRTDAAEPVTVNEWSLTFVNAARVAPVGIDRQQTVFNYYLGNDPTKWRSNVSSFAGVVYENLWPGIDAHMFAQDGAMRYEFHVHPGGDPNQIALRYDDVESLSITTSGGLLIRTSDGTIASDMPSAWQNGSEEARVSVRSKFVALDQFTYTLFPAAVYDSSQLLMLDAQLPFGSYLGGDQLDRTRAVAPDDAGGVWIVGETRSANFPTPGGFDTTFNGSTRDAFVARINAAGEFAFASYFGGGDIDVGIGITPDGSGGAWITGSTASNNIPTPGGFDTTYNEGISDTFVGRVTSTGALAFASYLGGVAEDYGSALAPDGSGGAWIGGQTLSADFPTPAGFDTTHNTGRDGFISHVSASGTLVFGSFLGGTGNDLISGVSTDGAGGAWVIGNTTSANIPTPGGFDTTFADDGDAYVAHVAVNGVLAFGSYLGGTQAEEGIGIAPAATGGVWLVCYTQSPGLPTPNGFDSMLNGISDAFIARLTANGTLAFASYLGGTNYEVGVGITDDGTGGALVTGQTRSNDFPTPGGFDTTYNGGGDAFVAAITSGGSRWFGSFLGGTGEDYGSGVIRDATGGAWVAGITRSLDFPTAGGFDTTYGGNDDAFIARVSNLDITAPNIVASQFAYESPPQSIRITFSESVSVSLAIQDFQLENLTTSHTIPSANLLLSYNNATNVATITFPGYPYGALPNGNYRATLFAPGVTDAAGNPLPSNHVLTFLFKLGDADHNGVINFDDYARIDNGFNNGLTGFSNGDFNYDGVINFDDYAIIDLAFNTQSKSVFNGRIALK